jgi:MFS family permease
MFSSFGFERTPTLNRLFAGVFISAIGTGMTLSLLLVYLHELRGFTNSFGGFILAYMATIAVAFTAPAGWLIDKIGPKPVALFGLLLEGGAVAGWALVNTKFEAILVASLSAIGTLMIWPPQTVMITRATDPSIRQNAFALNFMLLNLGIAFGGLLAASIVKDGDLQSFQVLYFADSLSYAGYFLILLTVKSKFKKEEASSEPQVGGYREVLRDRTFIRISLGSLIYLTFGYASLQAGLAIYTTQFLGLSPKWLGLIFAANTITIFMLQGFVLKWLEAIRDLAALRKLGYLWGGSWIVIGSAAFFSGQLAGILVALSQVIFAFGEMIWAPKAPSIVNRLAPENLRGRYNALMGAQWNVAMIIGAAIFGFMIGRDLYWEWLTLMLLGSLAPLLVFRNMPELEKV